MNKDRDDAGELLGDNKKEILQRDVEGGKVLAV